MLNFILVTVCRRLSSERFGVLLFPFSRCCVSDTGCQQFSASLLRRWYKTVSKFFRNLAAERQRPQEAHQIESGNKKWRADLCAARAVVLSRACNEVGHGRSPCAFSRRFCAVKSGAAGGGSFHDLRHTFATMALQNGVDVKTVSSMLGHYSAGFTLDTYAHVTTDAQLKAAQTMGNILSRAV